MGSPSKARQLLIALAFALTVGGVLMLPVPASYTARTGGRPAPRTSTITVGQTASATADIATFPSATTSGDIIIVFAYNENSTTLPTAPSGYTLIQQQSGSVNAFQCMWKLSTGDTDTGTWTNATQVLATAYHGVDNTTPIGASQKATGSTTSVAYQTLTTMTHTDGTSWVVGAAGAKGATSGLTGTTTALTANRTNQAHANFLDTNGGVTSFAQQTMTTVGTTRWSSATVELLQAAAPTPTATSTATSTFTPTSTATSTFTPTATATFTPSATTPPPTATATSTFTPTSTATFTPTSTATFTPTPTPSATPIGIFRTQSVSADSNTVSLTSATGPNELIVVFAYNANSVTIPALPVGYTSLGSGGGTGNAYNFGYRLSYGGDTDTGVWTNATSVAASVYQNVNTTTPIVNPTNRTGTGTSINYGGFTLAHTDGSSWITAFGGARLATAGMDGSTAALTNRSHTLVINALGTGGGVSTFANQTLTISPASAFITETAEIIAASSGAVPTPTPTFTPTPTATFTPTPTATVGIGGGGNITRSDAVSSNTSSVTFTNPTVAGDLIVIFAYGTTNTTPTTVSGYTSMGSTGASLNSYNFAYKVSPGGETSSGTWVGAAAVVAQIYKNVDNSTGNPVINATNHFGSLTTINFPSFPLTHTDGTSWVVGFVGAKAANSGDLSASTATLGNRTNVQQAGGLDSGTGYTSATYPGESFTITGSGSYITETAELVAVPGTPTPTPTASPTPTATFTPTPTPTPPSGTLTRTLATSAAANSVSFFTAPSAGDLIVVFAYNETSVTVPVTATGYTSLGSAGGSLNAYNFGYKIATGGEGGTGTWTNATEVVCQIYRNADPTTPVLNPTNRTGSGTNINYAGFTMTHTDGSSWIVGFAGARAATAGMNGNTAHLGNRTFTTKANGLDTGGGVTTWVNETISPPITGAGAFISETAEIVQAGGASPTPTPTFTPTSTPTGTPSPTPTATSTFTPTPTPTGSPVASPTPTQTPACAPSGTTPPPEIYGLNIDNPCNPSPSPCSDMLWYPFLPPAWAGPGPWPAVVLVHGGRFKQQDPGPFNIARDIACAGYIVFAIQYRMAPPHVETNPPQPLGDGQIDPPSDGRPNYTRPGSQQTDDVMTAMHAARLDSRVNGWVAAMGTSGGGHQVMWATVVGTPGDTKPDALVSLSGPFDVDNPQFTGTCSSPGANLSDIQNYLNRNLCTDSDFHTVARSVSGPWQTYVGKPCPADLFNSTTETIPSTELSNVVPQLQAQGGYVEWTIRTGNDHAANMWPLGYDATTGNSNITQPPAFPDVRSQVIDFLNRVRSGAVGSPSPTPTASPTATATATGTPSATPTATATATPTGTPSATPDTSKGFFDW